MRESVSGKDSRQSRQRVILCERERKKGVQRACKDTEGGRGYNDRDTGWKRKRLQAKRQMERTKEEERKKSKYSDNIVMWNAERVRECVCVCVTKTNRDSVSVFLCNVMRNSGVAQ